MRQFTNDEIQLLTTMYQEGATYADIGRRLDRARGVVGDKARQLGLKRDKPKKICPICNNEFELDIINAERQAYCSNNCRHKSYKKNNPTPPNIKGCLYCDKSFISINNRAICSDECRALYSQRLKNKNRKIIVAKCSHCPNRFVKKNNKSLCGKCKVDRNAIRMQRAKQNGQFDADINIYKLIERDGEQCYLCGDTVSFDCHYNDLKYPTMEHVLAIKNGGTHSWDNTKVACRDCNNKKGIKII